MQPSCFGALCHSAMLITTLGPLGSEHQYDVIHSHLPLHIKPDYSYVAIDLMPTADISRQYLERDCQDFIL